MLLSDLKDVLFGSFEAQLASDDAATSFATDVDALAKKIARNLNQRYVSDPIKKLIQGRVQCINSTLSMERTYGVDLVGVGSG